MLADVIRQTPYIDIDNPEILIHIYKFDKDLGELATNRALPEHLSSLFQSLTPETFYRYRAIEKRLISLNHDINLFLCHELSLVNKKDFFSEEILIEWCNDYDLSQDTFEALTSMIIRRQNVRENEILEYDCYNHIEDQNTPIQPGTPEVQEDEDFDEDMELEDIGMANLEIEDFYN